jgi:hypothetical protein
MQKVRKTPKLKKKAALVTNESGYCLAVKVEENEMGGLVVTIRRCEKCSGTPPYKC